MRDTLPGVTGYVLAGGRSSRMGQDKAELRIGGSLLIERAISKLRDLCDEVVVVGRGEIYSASRALPDLHPGCGPIGGIEAALRDAREAWAIFLPVDMPLLPGGLVRAFACDWLLAAQTGARVGMAEIDGEVQPLLSMVHRELRPFLTGAIARGQFRVRPVLAAAAAELAAQRGVALDGVLRRTSLRTCAEDDSQPGDLSIGVQGSWTPTAREWRMRGLWSSNLNTPEEYRIAERALGEAMPAGMGVDARTFDAAS